MSAVVKADDGQTIGDCKAIVVENEQLRLSVLPELGAKIYDVLHKETGQNVLWHNPRVHPHKVPFGSRFDDVYSGGWDEIFPNDAEVVVGSDRFPEMGEAWSLPWDYEIEERRNSVTLTTKVQTPISPAELQRKLTLRNGESKFSCDYEFRNLSHNEIKFLWKVHAAFPINKACRIEIPAKHGIVEPKFSGSYSPGRYNWPLVRTRSGKKADVSIVDPERNDCTLHFVTNLREGLTRFVDGERGLASTLRFDRETLDNVWLWLAYGGWRGHFTAVIEPCTSYPMDLNEAIRKKHFSRLGGGEKMASTVEFEVEALE